MVQTNDLIDARSLSKLRWRCRRGLLENDIFIDRFFRRYGSSLTVTQSQSLGALMELSDNDLLDLHLARQTLAQVDADLDREDVREVLCMLRKPLERQENEII
ncbi:MAG: succinate dehydrogenase assembly factor 2 [Rhodoferax sp.]